MQNSFGRSIIPLNDDLRLASLYSYQIVGSGPERVFNNLAAIMARCFNTPIALISLVDKEEVYFKANIGMPGVDKVPRSISLCSLAVLEPQPIIIEDALTKLCLANNPLVAGEFGLRFYAGAPIITPDGYHIGTACVVDKQPRSFSVMDQKLLARFADSAMKAIQQRRDAHSSANS